MQLPPRGTPQRYAVEFMIITGVGLALYLLAFNGPGLLKGLFGG